MPREISANEVNDLCDLSLAIESQEKVFRNFANGTAFLGPRAVLSQGDNAQFAYLARASQDGPTIVKFGSVFPKNAGSNFPVVQTEILVMNPINGSVEYSFDGESVTKLRTVAASMVAAKALARSKVDAISIIGLGHQGIAHAKAFREIYPTAKLIGIGRREISDDVFDKISTDSNEISGSEIVLLATSSSKPVLQAIDPGVTVISIGSFAPNRSEVSAEAVLGTEVVVVDDIATSKSQCGSIIEAERIGKLEMKSLGEILLKGGIRSNDNQRALYFSVGLGIQDAALVELILERL